MNFLKVYAWIDCEWIDLIKFIVILWTVYTRQCSGIFLPIDPGPIKGLVPSAKKYVFFPISMKKLPILMKNSQSEKFPKYF